MTNSITRAEAEALLFEFTQGDALRKHGRAVEVAMRAYARFFGHEDEEEITKWGIVGLLHDFDYEKNPTEDTHLHVGQRILRERGYREEIVLAICSHADYMGIPRDTPLRKAIYACDELVGFIGACVKVRPSKKIADLPVESVVKKLKDISGEVARLLGRQRMERQLAALEGHLIVCGFGRRGRLVCEQFSAASLPFVLVEAQAPLLENFRMPHGIPLHGDATAEDVLRRAGVERARALVTAAASDADNLYITMTARLLNDKLLIVARAEEEAAEKKLKRAGASRVVSPYAIGGQRVAQAVLRPNVMDFLELATKSEHLELQIEETEIVPGSALSGQSLKDSAVRQDLGVIVVAIKKPSGQMLFNPAPSTVIEAKDLLITLGHRQQLDRLERMART